ncbi:double zinc ribbon domain-containing protein [Pseudomonadota bacterium]
MKTPEKIYNKILDFFFPDHCPMCNKINIKQSGLCADCWSKVKIIKEPACDICNYPFEVEVHEGAVCPNCINKWPLYKKARSIFVYNDFISKIIFDFKYRDKINNAKFFTSLLKSNCQKIINTIDVIIPVPLHKKRLQERKYNQALLIAKELAKTTNKICIGDLLIRTINNCPQVGLVGKERLKNVKNIFTVNESYLNDKNFERIKDKNVLLIDDVMTTGATLNNCTKALLKHKVNDVYVLTVARTVVGS